MKLPVTLMVITLNEENNIERCIQSVPFASEILIIDSGSQDKTCEMAKKSGARVLQHEWKGFGPQKKWGSEQAQYDWILSLDADEVLSPELVEEIQQGFGKLEPTVGYEMPRKSFHLGRWIQHGGWYPDRQLRLYHRGHSSWPDSQIHERIQAQATKSFEADLHHFVFRDLSHQVLTNDRYSSLLSAKDFTERKKFSLFKLIFKPLTKFFETYFLKLGFFDGLAGLIIAVSAAYSIFLRQAKLWEQENIKK